MQNQKSTIRAIIIGEKGSFKNLNGKTFDVLQIAGWLPSINTSFVNVVVPDKSVGPHGFLTVGVALKNILFVDADEVMQRCVEVFHVAPNDPRMYVLDGMKEWARIHNVKFPEAK